MQGHFNIYTSINVKLYVNKVKNKNHMILPIDAKKKTKFKICDKKKLDKEAIYYKLTSNIILNSEKLKAFLLKLGVR